MLYLEEIYKTNNQYLPLFKISHENFSAVLVIIRSSMTIFFYLYMDLIHE